MLGSEPANISVLDAIFVLKYNTVSVCLNFGTCYIDVKFQVFYLFIAYLFLNEIIGSQKIQV